MFLFKGLNILILKEIKMPNSMNPNKNKTPMKGHTTDTKHSGHSKGSDRVKKEERTSGKSSGGMHSQGFGSRDLHNKSK